MRALSASDILRAADLARETVDVPEWGGAVTVRELSLGERLELAKLAGGESPAQVAAWLVATAAIDPSGEPLFPADERGDAVAALLAKQAGPVNRLSAAVMRLSGYLEEAETDALAGN